MKILLSGQKILAVLLFTLLLSNVYGQFTEEHKTSIWDKVYFGGNFGLSFGTVTQVDLSPVIGYHVTPRFSAGIGGTYQYYKETVQFQQSAYNYVYSTSIYGPKVFANFILIDGSKNSLPINIGTILLDAEYELLNVDTYGLNYLGTYYVDTGREWISNILAGGGIRVPLGGRASADILILWNLNENQFSPYSNPMIRFGLNL